MTNGLITACCGSNSNSRLTKTGFLFFTSFQRHTQLLHAGFTMMQQQAWTLWALEVAPAQYSLKKKSQYMFRQLTSLSLARKRSFGVPTGRQEVQRHLLHTNTLKATASQSIFLLFDWAWGWHWVSIMEFLFIKCESLCAVLCVLCNLSQPGQPERNFLRDLMPSQWVWRGGKKPEGQRLGPVWSVAMHNALTNGFQLHIGFCD